MMEIRAGSNSDINIHYINSYKKSKYTYTIIIAPSGLVTMCRMSDDAEEDGVEYPIEKFFKLALKEGRKK